jgi:hypothetical protein
MRADVKRIEFYENQLEVFLWVLADS